MSNKKDDVLNINVGGKKFSVRRGVLTMDPQSRLTEWFKANSTKPIPQDKSGNYFLDRDGRMFSYVLNYLRLKREKQLHSLALPAKPDVLAKLYAEAEALKLDELKELCFDMLNSYQREEAGYIAAFTKLTLRNMEAWREDHQENRKTGKATEDW